MPLGTINSNLRAYNMMLPFVSHDMTQVQSVQRLHGDLRSAREAIVKVLRDAESKIETEYQNIVQAEVQMTAATTVDPYWYENGDILCKRRQYCLVDLILTADSARPRTNWQDLGRKTSARCCTLLQPSAQDFHRIHQFSKRNPQLSRRRRAEPGLGPSFRARRLEEAKCRSIWTRICNILTCQILLGRKGHVRHRRENLADSLLHNEVSRRGPGRRAGD